jgi:hypothetical protein
MILALVNKQFYSKVRSHSNQYLSKLIMSDSRPAFKFNVTIRDELKWRELQSVGKLADHISM